MAAPNITGSLYLLQEYYAKKTGSFMRAATLKGLACHTAFDAGNVGPDYIYGWGLLDMKKAAQAITDNGTKSLIQEDTLTQGQTRVIKVTASVSGPLTASISWTDPPGAATPDGTVGNNSPKLINDLDIRISDGTTTFLPWVLNPANPSAPATTGDNIRDNIEQIVINGAVPGKNYTITVSHKGTLQSGSQYFSLIVTGVGGSVYCSSAPLSNADSRINNLAISNVNYSNTQGCTSYTDNTNTTVQLEQNKTYLLSITLGTCGGNFNKAAKIFIDWNGNGVFDSNELVATTGIINGTGTYTTRVTVPSTVIPGNFSVLRVVLTETSDTSSITACGNYAKGETQDYRVQFLQSSIDAGVIAVVDPGSTGSCSGTSPITIRLKNYGSLPLTNIPVTALVTGPNKTTTAYSGTYTATLPPLYEDNFTFPGSVSLLPGSSYIIKASTKLTTDADTANNQFIDTLLTGSPPLPANLTAYYCDNSNNYLLSGSGDGELLWYKSLTDSIPFAYGTDTTTVHPANNTFYAGLNDFAASIGPATKNIYPGGGYDQFTPSVNVSTQMPVIIQSARLYIGNSGEITFTVTNSNNEVVSQTTIHATATSTKPVIGAQADDPNDQGSIYQLNLLLPTAGRYAITATYDSTATIYRNDAYKGGYPLRIGNIFSVVGNTATSATDTAVYKNYYYYFYNMQLKSPGCASAERQPVPLSKPVITQTGEVLYSNFSSGNQWYLNGNLINGATGQSYKPETSGNYQLQVTVSSGCVLSSDNFVYILSSTAQGSDIGLVAFPIPATSQLNIIFSVKAASASNISLINMLGQSVYSAANTLSEGNFSTSINTSDLSAGTYVLKILLGEKKYIKKVIIIN